MRVGDHQLHAGQAPDDKARQERGPAGAVFGGKHLHTEDFAISIRVHAGRDDRDHVTLRPP